jgi:hypothetical protein
MRVKFLQEGFVVLQVASTSMETQDAHKNILVIRKVGHCFDVFDMACWKTHIKVENQYRQCTLYKRVCTQYAHV